MEEEKLVNQIKSNNGLYISIWFLFLVLFLTFGLYFYNDSVVKTSQEYENNIKNYQESINTLKSDKNMIVYELINKNKASLEKMRLYSQINTLFRELDNMSSLYSITLKWFSYSNWSLSTSVIVNNVNTEAYLKVSNFFKAYRENDKALFDLAFVNSFTWDSTILFNINLKLKENTSDITLK